MKTKPIVSDSDLHRLASRALRAAIRKLIKERAHEGRPLVIWRDGKVVKVSARRILRERKEARLKRRHN